VTNSDNTWNLEVNDPSHRLEIENWRGRGVLTLRKVDLTMVGVEYRRGAGGVDLKKRRGARTIWTRKFKAAWAKATIRCLRSVGVVAVGSGGLRLDRHARG